MKNETTTTKKAVTVDSLKQIKGAARSSFEAIKLEDSGGNKGEAS